MRKSERATKKSGMPRVFAGLLLAGCLVLPLSLSACGSAVKDSGSTGSSAAGSTDATTDSTTDSNADLAAKIVDTSVEDANIDQFITLGEYKNLTLKKTVSASSDSSSTDSTSADVPAIVKEINEYSLTFPDSTTLENGQIANIDYEGKIDGVDFDGGTSKGYDLTIGNNNFLTGFDTQLIGHKKGDTVDVKVTFPTTYSKTELAGKDAVFTVTINEIKADLWNYVIGKASVLQYPKDVVDMWAAQVAATYSYYASANSMDDSTFRTAAGITISDEDQAKINTKTYLVARAIMKAEGVTSDSDEYKSILNGILSTSGYSTESDATAAGISQLNIDVTTSYYVAFDLLVKNAESVTEVAESTATSSTTTSSTAS